MNVLVHMLESCPQTTRKIHHLGGNAKVFQAEPSPGSLFLSSAQSSLKPETYLTSVLGRVWAPSWDSGYLESRARVPR